MIKRINGLILVCLLLVSCNFSDISDKGSDNLLGELIVNNQSSVNVREIKYCGKQLYYKGEGGSSTGSVLPRGKKARAEFSDEETGYVFFQVSDRDVAVDVRTNEIFTIEKGKKIVLTITDNTLVVLTGGKEPSTVLDLVTPAVLKIENRSSEKLYNVRYKEKLFTSSKMGGDNFDPGSVVTKEFYGVSKYSNYVYFFLYGYELSVEMAVEIERGYVTTLVITDDTPIIRSGKAKRIKLSEIYPQGFEVVNNTSYNLYDVRFYYDSSSSTEILQNKDVLNKGSAWYVGFKIKNNDGYIKRILRFKIKISDGVEEEFRLYESLYLNKLQNTEVLLLDDVEVYYPNSGNGKHGRLIDVLSDLDMI